MTENTLHGTWRLESLKFEFSGTAQSADMYGSDPHGYLIITPDGRMAASRHLRRARDAAATRPAKPLCSGA